MKTLPAALFALLILSAFHPFARADDLSPLLSKLQAMSHGYYPAAEWNEVVDELHDRIATSKKRGDFSRVIEVTLIEGHLYADLLKQHRRAAALLTGLKEEALAREAADTPNVYVRLAQVYAIMGRDDKIRNLIAEFKAGPHYDPDRYAVRGGESPGHPVEVARPHARGDASLTVSSMQVSERSARFAAGRMFPDFEALTLSGELTGPDRSGAKVLLLDFWAKEWPAWARDLANLKHLYQAYHDAGFEILGAPLGRDRAAVRSFLRQAGLGWPQLDPSPPGQPGAPVLDLAARCGLVGEAGNFLLDGEGRIVGRNLYGSDLAAVVRKALAVQGP